MDDVDAVQAQAARNRSSCFLHRRQHDCFLPCCADRAGPLRFLSQLVPAGESLAAESARRVDRSRRVLCILFRIFLREPKRAAAQRSHE